MERLVGAIRAFPTRRLAGISAAALFAVVGPLALLASVSRSAPSSSSGADVSLTKADSPDPVFTSASLTYSIQVANSGPESATNVIVTDKLPKGAGFVSADSTQGTCGVSGKASHQKVSCSLGTLSAGIGPQYNPSPVAITIHVLAPSKAGTISNTASVDSALKDPKRGNNSATATTRVLEAPVPTCRGHKATVIGTAGADVLTGSAGDDVIFAGAAGDQIFSLGGGDLICAGTGGDLVMSGAQSDEVLAGPGADRVLGGSGGDVLRGGRGPDRIRGGRGADLLVGGLGRDHCFGGPGFDLIRSCR